MATTNMTLTLAEVEVTAGPTWASILNAAFNTIDGHDHTTGKGKQIPTAGLNINAALSFNDYGITALKSLSFQDTNTDDARGPLQVLNGDLYFGSLQITNGESALISTGGIGGDYGDGSESLDYTTASTLYSLFKNDSGEFAKAAVSDLKLYSFTDKTKYAELKSSASISSNYALTLPTALPSLDSFLTSDSSGNLSWTTKKSAIVLSSNGSTSFTVSVASASYAKVYDSAQTSTDYVECDITTKGGKVVAQLVNQGSSSASVAMYSSGSAIPLAQIDIRLLRDGSPVAIASAKGYINDGQVVGWSPAAFKWVDSPSAGTYNYQLEVRCSGADGLVLTQCKLLVEEI